MIINAMLPYIALTMGWALPALKRRGDRKPTKENKHLEPMYRTKKTSMAMYKKLFSGAQYVIHFK